jgi:hypothetical protein
VARISSSSPSKLEELVGDHLERHLAIQIDLPGTVDLGHAALGDRVEDLPLTVEDGALLQEELVRLGAH